MNDKNIDFWSEVGGGLRGSVMLLLGTVTTASGGLIDLGAQIFADANGPSETATFVAWVLFIIGLWLLAAGFFWVGSHPFLTRFGFVVGAFHAAQGIYLLILLFTFTAATIPPVSLTIGRLLATLLFPFIEKEWLDKRTRNLLVGAASLQLLKVSGRVLGFLPELSPPFEPLLDAVLLLGLAAALLHLRTTIRYEENSWAKTIYETSHSDFADFNNPEHAWNKPEPGKRKNRKG